MNTDLKELLEAKIEAELNALDSYSPTTEEHYHVVENVVKLYKLKTDEDETDFRERELRVKEIQTERQNLVDYVKLGAEIAGIVLPLVFYGYWMNKGLKFEETGSFTSDTFRGLIRWFKPVKK